MNGIPAVLQQAHTRHPLGVTTAITVTTVKLGRATAHIPGRFKDGLGGWLGNRDAPVGSTPVTPGKLDPSRSHICQVPHEFVWLQPKQCLSPDPRILAPSSMLGDLCPPRMNTSLEACYNNI